MERRDSSGFVGSSLGVRKALENKRLMMERERVGDGFVKVLLWIHGGAWSIWSPCTEELGDWGLEIGRAHV